MAEKLNLEIVLRSYEDFIYSQTQYIVLSTYKENFNLMKDFFAFV